VPNTQLHPVANTIGVLCARCSGQTKDTRFSVELAEQVTVYRLDSWQVFSTSDQG